jgi:hypothetical protein
VINAAIATLIIVLMRPDPTPAPLALPAGGNTDARVRELVQQLEAQRRELERKLAEIDKQLALILELSQKLNADSDRTAPRVPDRTVPPTKVVAPTKVIPPTKVPPTKVVTPSTPTLDRVAISTTIQSVKPQISACGSRFPANGTLKVRVRVAPDGSVTSASIDETPDEALGACVASVIASAKFPRTQGGAFSYPFVFSH